MAGLLLPVGVLAAWANQTFFDSRTFSERTVQLLDSPAMRRELAERITEQLALAGNQQAINFRPAFQLAIEGVTTTDAFLSIFRSAVMRAHQEVLRSGQGGALDLSDSVAIIAATVQLAQGGPTGEADERSLDRTLTDVTDRVSALQVWRWDNIATVVVGASLAAAVLFAAAAIALASDRRRMARRLGWVVVVDGLVLFVLVLAAVWFAGRIVSGSQLSQAVQDSVEIWTSDLRTLALWLTGYGIVVAAAAAPAGGRITPSQTATLVGAWITRQREHTGSTLGLSALFVLTGVVLVAAPSFWLRVAVLALGLWLVYFGVTEVLSLVRSRAPAQRDELRPVRRYALSAAVVVVALLVLSAGMVATASRAARHANALGTAECNGDESLCDLPLNRVVFPATHNSMSAALNPGWLFAEHVRTIASQLQSGVRALLIDTHYGIQSSSRIPGSNTPLILTDLAAELSRPGVEEADPETAARAAELAAKSPPRADAIRELYLCHNYCELGAIRFADVLGDIKSFLDTHPEEVVMTIIQDATTPVDTADAIRRAGLEERAYTLQPNQPMPTLRTLIESRKTLVVFAEVGGDGAPPWYHRAYAEWFQETPYQFETPAEMSCGPNRGPADAPLFLINHWLHASPPDPARANSVNRRDPLTSRLRRCLQERGLIPNVVAVDFAEQGDLIGTVKKINASLVDELRRVQGQPRPSTSVTTARGGRATTTTVAGGEAAAAAPLPLPTPTKITTLTGGNPQRFCVNAPPARAVIAAWALAQAVAPRGGVGLSDLAFGPAAARGLDALTPDLPAELVKTTAATRERARAAVQALTDLGMTAAAINDLASLAQARLTSGDYPDPVAVQAALLDKERALVGADRLDGAARAFLAAHPPAPDLFDLGEVTPEAATSAGYTCLARPPS
ncbi:MAG: hypothetical protein ACRD12_03195 [Acidimicrobiales bacterium]